jgi:CreA protein
MRRHVLASGLLAFIQASPAVSDDIGCVSTAFRFIGANDKVCVSAFDDPKVQSICYWWEETKSALMLTGKDRN